MGRFHVHRAGFLVALALLGALAMPSDARASFHLWKIREVFSNADGRIQYIELSDTSNFEHLVGGHTITATSGSTTRTFTIPSNLPSSSTAGRRFLVATPGFADLPGAVTPDYVLPCGAFFDPSATSITIDFSGVDLVTFSGSALPTNGSQALDETLATVASSPTNFDGDAGSLALSACLASGTCDPCGDDDALFCNGARSCAGGACVATPVCAGMLCDEGGDRCVECLGAGDCGDENPCTDDGCDDGTCEHTPNSDGCDDGFFCTMTDQCAGGTCGGSGDPCAGMGCNEGSDTCGACSGNPDCDDGLFCNGAETCNASDQCVGGIAPCGATEACVEATDACAGVCGNGVRQTGEACDDGDDEGGDGCSATCAIEPGFTCVTATDPSVCMRDPAGTDGGVDGGMRSGGGCHVGSARSGAATTFAAVGLLLAALARRRRRS